MIIWTFVLVVALGFVVSLTLLQPPDVAARRIAGNRNRSLASIEAQAPENLGVPRPAALTAAEVNVICEAQPQSTFQSNIRQVRLSGALCERSSKSELLTTEVTNETNGFNGTVFMANAIDFTTDYISLADGTNRIKILHRYRDGATETREVVIDRSPFSLTQ
jgi:hypothetical protein